MTFKKGESGNPTGRPKGATNRTTEEIRNVFSELLTANIENIQADLDSLDPKDRLAMLFKLSEFIIPKLQSTKMDISAESTPHTIKIGYGNLTVLAVEESKDSEKIQNKLDSVPP